MDRALQRVITPRWLRGARAVPGILAMPAWLDVVQRTLDPGRERRELAYAVERQQRAGGETFIARTGERVRAVVYTPVYPSEADEISRRRQAVRWSRFLAALSVL